MLLVGLRSGNQHWARLAGGCGVYGFVIDVIRRAHAGCVAEVKRTAKKSVCVQWGGQESAAGAAGVGRSRGA